MSDLTEFFYALTPEVILDAIEVGGRRATGRVITLNSYENRVYQLELDDGTFVVGKFYRPGRWTDEAILDEHRFLAELRDEEIPVAAPLELRPGSTLERTQGIRYALFPRVGGRAPEEMNDPQLRQLGRLLARIHQVGLRDDAPHRIELEPNLYLLDNLDFLLDEGLVEPSQEGRYAGLVERLYELVDPLWDELDLQRIHGDAHLGNLLWSDGGLVSLDYDDMCLGPPVQDLWMLWGGSDAWAMRRRDVLLDGYESMAPFDRGSLRLVEALRSLRLVHWATWVARRRRDPAFAVAFPDFGTAGWWERQCRDLEEQVKRVEQDFVG